MEAFVEEPIVANRDREQGFPLGPQQGLQFREGLKHAEESGNIPAEFRSATLTVLVGQHDLQPVTANGRIELFTPRTTIGSDQNNHIVVMDNGVAPKQGEILWAKERWWYVDKSGAGTLIRYDQKSHEKTLQRDL